MLLLFLFYDCCDNIDFLKIKLQNKSQKSDNNNEFNILLYNVDSLNCNHTLILILILFYFNL